MVKRCSLEPETTDEQGWSRRRRVFSTSSDLPPWLARIVGGALVDIREDARWSPSLDELQLYTVNLSHTGLILVEEWCTYSPSKPDGVADGKTCKHLLVRVTVVPKAMRMLRGRLEAYLQRRYVEALAMGAHADTVILQEILEERARGKKPPPSKRRHSTDRPPPPPPPPPLPPPPPPPPQKRKLSSMLLEAGKWAALGLLLPQILKQGRK